MRGSVCKRETLCERVCVIARERECVCTREYVGESVCERERMCVNERG